MGRASRSKPQRAGLNSEQITAICIAARTCRLEAKRDRRIDELLVAAKAVADANLFFDGDKGALVCVECEVSQLRQPLGHARPFPHADTCRTGAAHRAVEALVGMSEIWPPVIGFEPFVFNQVKGGRR